jgi:iron complex transport system ATP-binding protein
MITEALADRLPPEMLWSEREAWDGPLDEPMPQRGGTLLMLAGAQVQFGAHCFGPFDVDVEAGERIAILGPSGAGKSTLLKLIVGDHVALDGAVRLDGQALAARSAQALARRRAVLPQGHAVAFGLPVELVVALGRIACEPDPQQATIVTAALAAASASHLAGRRFDTLSGGEQARVQLARVFAQLWDVRGGLLLVDEPLAALDPGLQFELMDALQAHARARGHALIAVLHDINHALARFERLWLVREGRLMADLPTGRAAIGALEQLYGIALHCVDDAEHGLAVLVRPARAAASPLRGLPTR